MSSTLLSDVLDRVPAPAARMVRLALAARPRPEWFTSPLHSPRVAARLGLWLGVLFTICFVTGEISHLLQHPEGWFSWPAHPVWLFRLTQGLHVVCGTAAVPVLLAKLWTVYPRLYVWPPVHSLAHLLERVSVLVLVAGTFFELTTGLLNIAHWYPWPFFFPPAHHAVAWLLMGALLVHVAVQLPVVAEVLGSPANSEAPVRSSHTSAAPGDSAHGATAPAVAGGQPSQAAVVPGHD